MGLREQLDEALQEWVMDDSKAATSNYGYKCARLALKAAEKEISVDGIQGRRVSCQYPQ